MDSNEKHWQEIFETVDMSYLPVHYIKSIVVTFDDNEVWDIDLETSKNDGTPIDEILDEFFSTYEDSITDIDFKLDFHKIKNDISRRTKKFLKTNK